MFAISPRATCSAVAFACIALAAGCKKEAPAAPAAAAAPAAPAAGAAASGALPRAKELVDKMTGEIAKRIDEVEAAGNDQARIRTIGEDLKRALEGTRTEGEELVKKLNEAEKKELDAYAKELQKYARNCASVGSAREGDKVTVAGVVAALRERAPDPAHRLRTSDDAAALACAPADLLQRSDRLVSLALHRSFALRQHQRRNVRDLGGEDDLSHRRFSMPSPARVRAPACTGFRQIAARAS